MADREILEELNKDYEYNPSLLSTVSMSKIIIIVIFVISFGVYIGNLLFGKNSLEVLLKLETKKEFLSKEVEKLKQNNAQLQKDYFELKELEP